MKILNIEDLGYFSDTNGTISTRNFEPKISYTNLDGAVTASTIATGEKSLLFVEFDHHITQHILNTVLTTPDILITARWIQVVVTKSFRLVELRATGSNLSRSSSLIR